MASPRAKCCSDRPCRRDAMTPRTNCPALNCLLFGCWSKPKVPFLEWLPLHCCLFRLGFLGVSPEIPSFEPQPLNGWLVYLVVRQTFTLTRAPKYIFIKKKKTLGTSVPHIATRRCPSSASNMPFTSFLWAQKHAEHLDSTSQRP